MTTYEPHAGPTPDRDTLAVFVDYLNLRKSCKSLLSIDLHHVPHSEALIQHLRKTLESLGDVRMACLYADLSRQDEDPGFLRALAVFKTLFTTCHVRMQKNGREDRADLFIMRDTYRLLWREGTVDHFVFVVGNADMTPVIEDILESGKRVTHIAVDPQLTPVRPEYHLQPLDGSIFQRIDYEQYYPLFVKVIFYGEKKVVESNWDVYTTGHLARFIRENKNGKFPILTLHEINECLEKMEAEKMLKTFATMNEKGKPTRGILLNHSHPRVESIIIRTRDH